MCFNRLVCEIISLFFCDVKRPKAAIRYGSVNPSNSSASPVRKHKIHVIIWAPIADLLKKSMHAECIEPWSSDPYLQSTSIDSKVVERGAYVDVCIAVSQVLDQDCSTMLAYSRL